MCVCLCVLMKERANQSNSEEEDASGFERHHHWSVDTVRVHLDILAGFCFQKYTMSSDKPHLTNQTRVYWRKVHLVVDVFFD